MQFTYENKGTSSFMVYSLSPGEEVDRLGLGMLGNNKIEGVLPVSFSQFNDERKLRFNISSQIPLEDLLGGVLQRKKALAVFSSITDTLISAEDYLLEREMFLLDKNYIFSDVSSGKSSIIYLPVLRKTQPVDLNIFFKKLIVSIQTDPTENNEYLVNIISFLNRPGSFNLEEFQKLLGSQQAGAIKSSEPPKSRIHVEYKPQTSHVRENIQSESKGREILVERKEVTYRPSEEISEQEQMSQTQEEEPTKKERRSLFHFGGASREDKKARKAAEKARKAEEKRRIKEDSRRKIKNVDFEFDIPDDDKSVPDFTRDESSNETHTRKETVKPERQPVKRKRSKREYSPDEIGETVVIEREEAVPETSLLGNNYKTEVSDDDKQPYSSSGYLFMKRTGEEVKISKKVFHVGKESSYADFCVMGNPTVSRSHADILTRSDNYFIRDMNSMNHTYLNGEKLTSNVPYELHDRDIIRMSDEEFEFRIR